LDVKNSQLDIEVAKCKNRLSALDMLFFLFVICIFRQGLKTLQRLTDWLGRVKENAPDCQIIFVGNKIDERENGSAVSLEEASEMAREYGAECMEVSAKTGDGVAEMFEAATIITLTKHSELVSN